MPSLTIRLHDRFVLQTTSIESTRAKMEGLFLTGHINLQDIEHSYAGLYMELFTDFEALLEDLFFGLYNGSYISRNYTIRRKSKITPNGEIQPIVYGGKSYVNWLPYGEHTLKRAILFFHLGEPFRQLTTAEINLITNYHTIRNAIAHKSPNSLNLFNRLTAALPLLPIERTPTGYLRSKPGGVGQTQFEIAAIELKLLTNKLCR
jgi:hypothetical protein